jgi:hypothetical protein
MGEATSGRRQFIVNSLQRRRRRTGSRCRFNSTEIACRVLMFIFASSQWFGPPLRPSIRDRSERCALVNRLPVRNLGSMAFPLGAGSSALADA